MVKNFSQKFVVYHGCGAWYHDGTNKIVSKNRKCTLDDTLDLLVHLIKIKDILVQTMILQTMNLWTMNQSYQITKNQKLKI